MRAVDTVIACAVTAGQLDDVDVRAIDRRLAASTPDAEGLDAAILGELVGRIRSGTYGNVDSQHLDGRQQPLSGSFLG